MTKSDTPRVDLFIKTHALHIPLALVGDKQLVEAIRMMMIEWATFARQLERETQRPRD